MSLATTGIPVSSFVLLAAGSAPVSFPVSADVMQGGALLTLSWCVCWVLARTVPSCLKAMKDQNDAHMQDSKEQREAFMKAIQSCIGRSDPDA
jgi:hypothetical protein